MNHSVYKVKVAYDKADWNGKWTSPKKREDCTL